MNMQWRRVSRRRGMVTAGALAVLLAAGGAASAATSGHAPTTNHDGVTLEEVPGVELPDAEDLPVGEVEIVDGGQPVVVEDDTL
ncbi:hypothetical protein AB0L99_12935 [Streptomyces sp. NPDC051954]|uniref:hypothetical protein n=1 Tax=unclassified Streptomyces TaxID=2593676 RepID=UPI0034157828